jgi:hypothetical protein
LSELTSLPPLDSVDSPLGQGRGSAENGAEGRERRHEGEPILTDISNRMKASRVNPQLRILGILTLKGHFPGSRSDLYEETKFEVRHSDEVESEVDLGERELTDAKDSIRLVRHDLQASFDQR